MGRHPIKLFIRDTRTNPDVAKEVVSKLIQKNKVRCIIGTYSSACAMAIKPICRNSQVLHIATISNSEDITKIDFSPYTFSMVPNTYMMAKGLIMGIAKLARKGLEKVRNNRFRLCLGTFESGNSGQTDEAELHRSWNW